MADPKPKMIYEYLSAERSDFINYAEEAAKLTLPWLSPRGTKIEERPWTSKGTSAVRALASTTLKLTMPPGVQWARIDLPPYVWRMLEERAAAGDKKVDPEKIARLKARLEQRSVDIMTSLAQKQNRSRFGRAILRNLVEGSTACHNSPEGVRIFPLRSFVNRRNEFSDIDLLVLMEELDIDPTMASEQGDFDQKQEVWTLIDYEANQVWQQTGENKPEKLDKEDPAHYWVFVTEKPDVEHYAIPYVYNYLRLIAQIDHEEAALAEAMAYASWNPIGVREGSVLAENPNQVTQRERGKPLVMQDGDIIFPDANRKIADWAFVKDQRNDDAQELGQAFAMGIKDRPIAGEASATAIIEIIDELNSQSQDLFSSYEETLQQPMARSENRIHDVIIPLFGPDEQALGQMLKVVITTGVNALDKQRTLTRYALQFLPGIMALDPALRVRGKPVADRMADSMLVDTEDWVYEATPEQMQREQLAAAGGGAEGGNGELPRTETVMTRGGPQPPQPSQPPPPTGG